uniref:Mechanosensitive ion channel protein n=1 Tax=Kalanchoe fedtschenkoi TaxID=63787 RepID=A0A7N0ZWI2_KALFE
MADDHKKIIETNNNDIVLLIPGHEEDHTAAAPPQRHNETGGGADEGSFSFAQTASSSATTHHTSFTDLQITPPSTTDASSVTRRRSITRSAYSKPKSRLLEPVASISRKVAEEIDRLKSPGRNSPELEPAADTPKGGNGKLSVPATPRAPLTGGPDEEDDDDEVYKALSLEETNKSGQRIRLRLTLELLSFVCIVALLVTSLTVDRIKAAEIWSLKLWRWCILILTVFCGRLLSEWFINVLVFLIERNFLLRKKVLYFVFGVRRSVQFFIWFALILLAWALLINRGVERSQNAKEILHYVTRTLISFLIWSAIWMFKTFMVKLLASNFHVTRFFDRIQESIFHQYVLQTLSGPPLMEMDIIGSSKGSGRLSVSKSKVVKGVEKEQVIDVEKLHKIKQEKVSAWTMRGLVKVISTSGLSTLTDALDDSGDDEGGEQKDKEITNEVEAKAAAYRIFRNVAKPNSKEIDEEDLLRFLKKEEVKDVLPLFDGAAETGKIKKLALRNWVVSAYNERKALAHSLNDTKTAIQELNRLLSAVVVIVGIIVWLIVMGFLTTQVLVLISSQLLLVVFMFGNSAKTAFEAIIFVFVMHPFDVGDRCVVDGVTLTVEEMNILTTVFLRYDNEKIFYPNSVLATKPISNFYRSPEMGDSVEFAIDVTTSFETIDALKARIKAYLESKPLHWRPSHAVQVKEIEQVNKMKMALYVTHTVNFQSPERGGRRSDLLLELKRIFEQLEIKYHLLPQEVRLSYIGSAPSPNATQ